MTVVFAQVGSLSVEEATYLGSRLRALATGSFGSVWFGQ